MTDEMIMLFKKTHGVTYTAVRFILSKHGTYVHKLPQVYLSSLLGTYSTYIWQHQSHDITHDGMPAITL